ncbi:TylF/MycF/NovP-related O-methyltransferase [Tenacibaculum maritimum]|uniref:TylF/MycF/NovP-related O-methyltransferase n=1 Tax=Tenacibaculum maritimum TaxID=107401 RepID=UPI0012E4A5DD|nr:TylF/MycF/NovP-related O-methyltransferase [Tenacibaculum maritimum]CAA0169855.1 hypothetical protein UCDSB2_130065 [Tenacibaculum maritimum]
MKKKIYYRIHHIFTLITLPSFAKTITHYLETFVYFIKFSKWIKKQTPPILDNKKDEKDNRKRRFQLHEKIFKNEKLEGEIIYLEFGVASGTSLKWWVNFNSNESSRFFGFDSFKGLPEAWFSNKKGDFNQNGILPDIKDDRLEFVQGLYQKTLFNFLKKKKILNKQKIIHIDADLYSSTLFVLTTLHHYLEKDDIIIFDDFAYIMGEYKALIDYEKSYYTKYKVIGAVNNYAQIAIKIS